MDETTENPPALEGPAFKTILREAAKLIVEHNRTSSKDTSRIVLRNALENKRKELKNLASHCRIPLDVVEKLISSQMTELESVPHQKPERTDGLAESDQRNIEAEKFRQQSVIEAVKSALAHDTPIKKAILRLRSQTDDFLENEPTPFKAYLFACLSELVYFSLTNAQIAKVRAERYNMIPSSLIEYLCRQEAEIDLGSLISIIFEVTATSANTLNASYLVLNFPRFYVIAVRGTLAYVNEWAIDFRLFRRTDGYHQGFYDESDAGLRALLPIVTDHSKPIFFTGHSMGAAVACMLQKKWPSSQRAMTPFAFACPRFASDSTAKTHALFSYARPNDPVPYLPPGGDFVEAGNPVSILPYGARHKSIVGVLAAFSDWIKSHNMGGYRALLGLAIGVRPFPSDVYLELLKMRLGAPEETRPDPDPCLKAIERSLEQEVTNLQGLDSPLP